MSVCLVTAPTVAEFADPAEIRSEAVQNTARDPQLGILSLAAVLEQCGECVSLVDLNRTYINYSQSLPARDRPEFTNTAARFIAATDSEVYGFSSICSSYPLTLRIAKAVKALCPDATIILGGPQASVVDVPTLVAFPFIDFVLRGEAEHTLPLLLEDLGGERRLDRVPGLTYRRGESHSRNANAPVIQDLDALPSAAYHLSHYLQDSDRASLELGRGCPFSCTFCSTNDFFRRKFRLRSPERVLRDMRAIASDYGIRHFELVHDMFTVDRRCVAEFCEAMIRSGECFTWSCSARTDCIDEQLLALMAQAGCTGIFYGVEVGSTKMQTVIDKHLDIARAHQILDATERAGIASTVSLIAGFPEETWDDIRQSLNVFMHSARCPKSHPQLNLLAPLAETPLLARHKHELSLEELCSCVSHQGTTQDRRDVDMIVAHPEIFPNFYVVATPHLERSCLFELREFTLMALTRFRWLLVAIDQSTSGIFDFYVKWREHRLRIRPISKASALREYYRTDIFHHDFLDFVRTQKVKMSAAVRALLDYEDALRKSVNADTRSTPSGNLIGAEEEPDSQSVPVRSEHAMILELSYDVQHLIEALKMRGKTCLSRGKYFYVTRPLSNTTTRTDMISDWLAYLLRLCDGKQSVKYIVQEFARQIPEVQESLRPYVCKRLLRAAHSAGLIQVYRPVANFCNRSRRGRSAQPKLSEIAISRLRR